MTRHVSRQACLFLNQSILQQIVMYLHHLAPRNKMPEIINEPRLTPLRGPSLFEGMEKSVVAKAKPTLSTSHGFAACNRPVPYFTWAARSPHRYRVYGYKNSGRRDIVLLPQCRAHPPHPSILDLPDVSNRARLLYLLYAILQSPKWFPPRALRLSRALQKTSLLIRSCR